MCIIVDGYLLRCSSFDYAQCHFRRYPLKSIFIFICDSFIAFSDCLIKRNGCSRIPNRPILRMFNIHSLFSYWCVQTTKFKIPRVVCAIENPVLISSQTYICVVCFQDANSMEKYPEEPKENVCTLYRNIGN